VKVRALVTYKKQSEIPAWLQWRVVEPYAHLKNMGFDYRHFYRLPGMPLEPNLNILVVPRLLADDHTLEATGKWFDKIRENGTKIVYETDDDIFSESYISNLTQMTIELNNVTTAHQTLAIINEFEERARLAQLTMDLCDTVTVTTPQLGAYVRSLLTKDQPVYVIPNAINIARYNEGLSSNSIYQNSNYITIGWSGGRRSPSDLETMVQAWEIVSLARPQVRFVVAGWMPNLIKDNPILNGKVGHIPWQPLNKYACGMQVDIGCVAVNDTPFSSRKTVIKAWEYALSGAAVVASSSLYKAEPLLPLCETVDDWIMHLLYYIDNPEHRHTQANMFKRHVYMYHDLATECLQWKDAYEGIVKHGVVRDLVSVS
jgi:hypothetical protein